MKLARLSSVLALLLGLSARAQEMTTHFINVGQANATLIDFPCGTMLIDCGAEDAKYADRLITYLHDNIQDHGRGKIIDLLVITHTHRDHNAALKTILSEFEVKRYIDNGDVSGSGRAGAAAVRKEIREGDIDTKLTEIRQELIVDKHAIHGLTSRQIDPFSCTGANPKIRIMSAARDDKPTSWSHTAFNEENNHSLVIRVDFGESSFLFPGDLEKAGIKSLLEYYQNNPTDLDVDVWEVNHHGADNGTTIELVQALTPTIAIISCGDMHYGEQTRSDYDAFGYGHPRASVIDILQGASGLQTTRPPFEANVADGQENFHKATISKAIYSTAWDGTIIIKGFMDKDPEVVKFKHEDPPSPN